VAIEVQRTDGLIQTAISNVEAATMKKVAWRIVPFLMVCYLIGYLDRVNVGFAGLTMNKDLGFSASVFGTGAGLFFLGYSLFEIPSTLASHRFGVNKWIARIMVSWGIVSMGMAFVSGVSSFYTLRILLGVAEAGFAPGILYYFSCWFPKSYRGRLLGMYAMSVPLAGVIGGPISGIILDGMNMVWGLKGWQWLFIIEGLPAVIMGVACWWVLTPSPDKANWLQPAERKWLENKLQEEREEAEAVKKYSLLASLLNPQVLLLGVAYCFWAYPIYGIAYFGPQIIKEFGGLSNVQIGFIAALPQLAAVIAAVTWGRLSDYNGERAFHLLAASWFSGAGFLLAGFLLHQPVVAVAGITIAAMGIWAFYPVFWTLPGQFLTGAAAAGGIAIINLTAVIGGYFAGAVTGWIRDATGNYAMPLLVMGGMELLAGVLVIPIALRVARLSRAIPATA
jgi:sugar phosphate permease